MRLSDYSNYANQLMQGSIGGLGTPSFIADAELTDLQLELMTLEKEMTEKRQKRALDFEKARVRQRIHDLKQELSVANFNL
jgi:hypothetical protein